jgi:hypothetical protein
VLSEGSLEASPARLVLIAARDNLVGHQHLRALAFAKEVRCGQSSGWKAITVNHMTAIFRQINKDDPRTHHDALEFPDGQIVLLTDVFEGQEASVLQLPAQPATAAEAEAQERVAHVG